MITHGRITTDLLRNLLDDDALPPQLLAAGIPPCAITTIDDLTVVMIASIAHLYELVPAPSLISATTSYRATSGRCARFRRRWRCMIMQTRRPDESDQGLPTADKARSSCSRTARASANGTSEAPCVWAGIGLAAGAD